MSAKIILISYLILFVISCKNIEKMSYSYFDGSGNAYHIGNKQIEYKPVDKKNSSSGFYSGGEAQKVQISEQDYKQIANEIENAFQHSDQHIKDRIMTSGMISKQKQDHIESKILAPNSECKNQIESLLNHFFKKE